jgi:DNA-binding transcriptional ArsR family regulator
MSNEMVTDRDDSLFRGIADPVRRSILGLLVAGPRAVEEIASHFPVSRPAVSKHLRVLKEAGLLAEERSGRQRFYQLLPEELEPVRRWLESLASGAASPPRSGRSRGRVVNEPTAVASEEGGQSRSTEGGVSEAEAGGRESVDEDWRSW